MVTTDFAQRAADQWQEQLTDLELNPAELAVAVRLSRLYMLQRSLDDRALRSFEFEGIAGIDDFKLLALLSRSGPDGLTIHALRKDIFYANRGEIRKRHEHEQDTQTLCLNLLTNAVIAWNTIYIGRIQQHLASSDTPLTDETITHTSPTIRAHCNFYGRYDLHAIKTPRNGQYRPLRNA